MKNILKIILLSTVIIFQSCDDALDIPPNTTILSEIAFRDIEDLQAALNSTYSSYNTSPITFNSIFTDNTQLGIDNGGQQNDLHSLLLNPADGIVSNMWITRFRIINRASRIIEASELITIKEGEQAEVNNILAQAYALRAFAQFELFQYFTPDYNNPDGISVPAVDFVATLEALTRNTVAEVGTLIDADLKKSANLLALSSTDNRFVTQDFITALRARKALYFGNYTEAISFSNSLIGKYSLANQSQYLDMFFDRNDSEVIFKAARVQGDAGVGFIWHFSGGGPFIEMSEGLFNILDGDQDDIRYEALLNRERISENVYLIGKYPRLPGIEFLRDIKVFRVSEMYLIKAEAEIKLGQLNSSQVTLKTLRDARFGKDTALPTYANESDAVNFLLNERRLELAFEGHRWLI